MMINALAILAIILSLPKVVLAGDINTGVVEKVISNGTQRNGSRIHYACYPVTDVMPAYQKTVNEVVSVGVLVSSEDEPKGTFRIDRAYFQRVLDDLASRFNEYVASVNDVNEAPWSLVDSTAIQDDVIINGQATAIAQIYHTHYEFTGGAHGNSWTSVTHVSKASGKKLFVIGDIIVNEKEFLRIAEKQFRKQRKLGPKTSLRKAGYDMAGDKFVASENIMLTNDELILIYNPYEIAPYVMGQIRITIPMSAIKSIVAVP